MLITNDFVMINFPKTGSSFAREAIKKVYCNANFKIHNFLINLGFYPSPIQELMLPEIDILSSTRKDQHGTYRQIPNSYRNKDILSITRNPFSRFISTFKYKWWQKFPPGNLNEIVEKYPDFPEINFEDYYNMIHLYGRNIRLKGINPKIDIGIHSIQFIQFYFKQPEKILSTIDDRYIENKEFINDMGEIYFIHQEKLRFELKLFLKKFSIPDSKLEIIDNMDNINVTKNRILQKDISKFYSEPLINKILEREKLIFKIFPDYLPNQKIMFTFSI